MRRALLPYFQLFIVLYGAPVFAQPFFQHYNTSWMWPEYFIVPPGITTLTIEVMGEGGNGGPEGGGGGGGGGYAKGVYTVSPGDSLLVVRDTASAVLPLICAGKGRNGLSGGMSNQPPAGGKGGYAFGGNLCNNKGGDGGFGTPLYYGGGGGGAAGPGSNGGNGWNAAVYTGTYSTVTADGGAGGGGLAGFGGRGGGFNSWGGTKPAEHGVSFGGGGGGQENNFWSSYSGVGAQGYIRIMWGPCESRPAPVLSSHPFCKGSSAQVHVLRGEDIEWSYDRSFTSPIKHVKSLSVGPLTDTLLVFARNGSCDHSDIDSVMLIPENKPTLTVTSSPSIVCWQSQFTFSVLVDHYANVFYAGEFQWVYGPYGSMMPRYTHNYSYTKDSTVYFQVVAENQAGCTDTCWAPVTLRAKPQVTCGASSSFFCPGQSVTLTANAPNAKKYEWHTGAGTASTVVKPILDSKYVLRITDNNLCVYYDTVPLEARFINLQIGLDHKTACSGDTVLLTASGAGSYTWSTGAVSPSILVIGDPHSIYAVSGFSNGCSATASIAGVAQDCTGFAEVAGDAQLLVFPNPTSGDIRIKSPWPGNVEIVDSTGLIVRSVTIESTIENYHFNLPPGIYLLRLNGTFAGKIIVNR